MKCDQRSFTLEEGFSKISRSAAAPAALSLAKPERAALSSKKLAAGKIKEREIRILRGVKSEKYIETIISEKLEPEFFSFFSQRENYPRVMYYIDRANYQEKVYRCGAVQTS